MATAAADSTAGLTANRIEALLSARLFVEPQLAGERLYFVSNLSGHLSLYSMDVNGGVPEPLLPPQLALQNPELVGGHQAGRQEQEPRPDHLSERRREAPDR